VYLLSHLVRSLDVPSPVATKFDHAPIRIEKRRLTLWVTGTDLGIVCFDLHPSWPDVDRTVQRQIFDDVSYVFVARKAAIDHDRHTKYVQVWEMRLPTRIVFCSQR
jgi:hypothetical protein